MSEKNSFHVSVVIPAYNNGKYIARAIESVLAQIVPADEIIVVDDGSTDDTAQTARSFGDRIVFIQQANAGASAARNTGIQRAKGEWIAFLDGDDEWLPQKLEQQTMLLRRNPHLMWTTGNYMECLCDENRSTAYTLPSKCARYLEGRDYFESYFQAIRRFQWGHTNCMLVHKNVFSDVGLFCTTLPKANDIDMWLRIAYRYPQVGFSCEPLAIYHLSTENSIVKKYRTTAVYTDFMDRHFEIAQTEGVLPQFLPAAGTIIRRWIRGMLFEGRKEDIRVLLNRFPQAVSPLYRSFIYALTVFPGGTAAVLHLLSKIIRRFRLRRRLTRPPQKS